MAPVEIVDLTGDSDDDISPTKAAKSILSSFQAPRPIRKPSVREHSVNGQLRVAPGGSATTQSSPKSSNVLSSHKKRRLGSSPSKRLAGETVPSPPSHGLPTITGFPSYETPARRRSQLHNSGAESQLAGPSNGLGNGRPLASSSARRSLYDSLGVAGIPPISQPGNANSGHERKKGDATSTNCQTSTPTSSQVGHLSSSAAGRQQSKKTWRPGQTSGASRSKDEAASLQRIRGPNDDYPLYSSMRRESGGTRHWPNATGRRPTADPALDYVSSDLETRKVTKGSQRVQNDLEGLSEARKLSFSAANARLVVKADEQASTHPIISNPDKGPTEVEPGKNGKQDLLSARPEQQQNTAKSMKRSLVTSPFSDDQRFQAKRQHRGDSPAGSSRHKSPRLSRYSQAGEQKVIAQTGSVVEDGPGGGDSTTETVHTAVISKIVPERSAASGKASSGAVGRSRYSEEQNALLCRLKTIERLSWTEIMKYFPERSLGSVQVHYSTTVKDRYKEAAKQAVIPPIPHANRSSPRDLIPRARSKIVEHKIQPPLKRRRRGGGPLAVDGFVPWTQIDVKALESPEVETPAEDVASSPAIHDPLHKQDRAFPSSFARVLRQRELGKAGSRGWSSYHKRTTDETVNHVLTEYQPRLHFMATSGDVTTLAWRSDGTAFTAGSIAITDDRSMQYNSSRNLLVGDAVRGELQELIEHHVSRPVITDSGNLNALHSMRESQDPRLFTTVATVTFSADGSRMFTAGSDRIARMYVTDKDATKYSCQYAIEHTAEVDIIDLREDLLATACHTSDDGSVSVFKCGQQSYSKLISFSPTRVDSQSSLATFPSAMKWGAAHHHRGFLLAGFASDVNDDDRDAVGETALWDVETGHRFDLGTITHNVFDVAWNPFSSSATDAFCVAGTPGHGKSVPGRKSVIQCYAANLYSRRAKQVLEWDCPAYDINDVLYCPHDDNLIAAGATDGRVYIWDKRFASRNQNPLHVLSHGESLNVLDHDRERELVDTGVRFLSWGATSSRLYSGSSDGVVKVWNPYRAPESAFVEDAATFQTAIMSGAFGADHCDLLIGEERGRINLLSMTGGMAEDEMPAPSQPFTLHSSGPIIRDESPFSAARALLASKQIELRTWGAMPKRQAVKGPAYSGPYLRPSSQDLDKAQEAYAQAMQRHDVIRADAEADDEDLRKASQDVESCQAALTALRGRELAYAECQPAASAKQVAWRYAQNRRITQEDQADHCKLDCNYFAPSTVDGVVDTQSSVQRIAGSLDALPRGKFNIAVLGCRALFENGIAGPCPYCPEISAKKPGMAIMLRQRCEQRCREIKARLSGTCESCSAPVNAQDSVSPGSEVLCARCNFGCFRCAKPVQILRDSSGKSSLFCAACDKAWEVGVLGYDLVQDSRNHVGNGGPRKQKAGSDFDTELDHYHSRWGEPS